MKVVRWNRFAVPAVTVAVVSISSIYSCGEKKQSFSNTQSESTAEESGQAEEGSESRLPVNVAGAYLVECYVVTDRSILPDDVFACWSSDHELQAVAVETQDGRVVSDDHVVSSVVDLGQIAVVGVSGIEPLGSHVGVVSFRPLGSESAGESQVTRRMPLGSLGSLEESPNRESIEKSLRYSQQAGRKQRLPESFSLACKVGDEKGTKQTQAKPILVSAPGKTCDWGASDVLVPLREGLFGAYSRTRYQVDLPPGHVLCDLSVRAKEPSFWYEDHVLISANDFIISSSIALELTPSEQSTRFPRYRWEDFRGKNVLTPGAGFCGGLSGQDTCVFPLVGSIGELAIEQKIPFWKLQPGARALEISVHAFGDNDMDVATTPGPWESDCRHKEFEMLIEVTSAPDL